MDLQGTGGPDLELRAREGDDRASGEGFRGVLHRGGSGRASPVGGCWHKWLGQGVVLLACVHLQRGTLGIAMYKTFRDRAGCPGLLSPDLGSAVILGP